MMEHWNTGLNKTILGFSCIIPELSFSNFSHFGIHLTSGICHLKLISSGLFHMPETGIVHKETGITVGAHLG